MIPFVRRLNYERFKNYVFLKHLIDDKKYTFGASTDEKGKYILAVLPKSSSMTKEELKIVDQELRRVFQVISQPEEEITEEIDILFDRDAID